MQNGLDVDVAVECARANQIRGVTAIYDAPIIVVDLKRREGGGLQDCL